MERRKNSSGVMAVPFVNLFLKLLLHMKTLSNEIKCTQSVKTDGFTS